MNVLRAGRSHLVIRLFNHVAHKPTLPLHISPPLGFFRALPHPYTLAVLSRVTTTLLELTMAAAQAQTASNTSQDAFSIMPCRADLTLHLVRQTTSPPCRSRSSYASPESFQPPKIVRLQQLSRHSKQLVDANEPSLSKIVLAREESRLRGHFEYLTDLSKLGLNECAARCINYYGPCLNSTQHLTRSVVGRRARSWARAHIKDETRTTDRPYSCLRRLYDVYPIRDEVKRAQAFERANQDFWAGELLASDPIPRLQSEITHGDLTESPNFVLRNRCFGQEPQDEQLLPFGSACRLLQSAFSAIQLPDLRSHGLFHCLGKKRLFDMLVGAVRDGKVLTTLQEAVLSEDLYLW